MIKNLIILSCTLLTIMLISSCSPSEQQTKIILYDTTALKSIGIPPAVISFKESNAFKIKNLVYKGDGKVSVELDKKDKEECCLVFFFSAKNEFLAAYVDSDKDFTIHSTGTVLFGTAGYKITVDAQKGKAEYKVTYKVWNRFDMGGAKGELYVFAVKGSVNPHSILPGNQNDVSVFNASSNVLKTNFEF